MSVLKSKRSTSKAEYVNLANLIYTETVAFLTRLSARYARLLAEPVAALAGEVIDHTEKANSIFQKGHPTWNCGRATCWRHGPRLWPWTCAWDTVTPSWH